MSKKLYFYSILFVVQSIIMILFFPSLEYPDGTYHITKIYNNNFTDVYFYFIKNFSIILSKIFSLKKISIERNLDFQLLNWTPLIKHKEYNNYTVMVLQLFNVFCSLVTLFFYNFIVKKDNYLNEKTKKNLLNTSVLYIFYPAISYLMLGITPDFFIYLYQPFFVYFIMKKKHLLNILLMLLLYFYQDGGIIVNFILLISYFFISSYNKMNSLTKKKRIIKKLTLILILTFFLVRMMTFLFLKLSPFYAVIDNSLSKNGTMYTKIINFVLSSFCFWGSGSYTTFPLFYVIYIYIVFKLFKKIMKNENIENKEMNNLFIASIFTIILIIIIIPPYSSIKYFPFYVFVLIMNINSFPSKLMKGLNGEKLIYLFFLHNVILTLLISFYVFVILRI